MIYVIIVLSSIILALSVSLFIFYRSLSGIKRQLEEKSGEHMVSPVLFKGPPVAACVVREVNSLIDRLNRSRIEHKKYDAVRKRFLSNISHDIRTPLTSIIGYISALKDDAAEDIHSNPAYLEILSGKTRELKERIDKLFEIAKLESGEWQLFPEQFDLAECVREVLIDFIQPLEKEHFHVEIQLPDSAVMHYFDRLSFIRIVQNLIQNVLIHGTSGRYLFIKLAKEDGIPVLIIRDKGPGIKGDYLEDIFKRSFTSPGSPVQEGSGLGLAIVRELVHLNRARITAESPERSGTTFQIYFNNC